jgi:hypothetical protein
MLKLPKNKININVKHNEDVKKTNSDEKVNKMNLDLKQIKLNPNNDPVQTVNKCDKNDIKKFINEKKKIAQNNNINNYEISTKAVNNDEQDIASSQFQDFLKLNKKEVINNNKELLIDFETIKYNDNPKIKIPKNNLIDQTPLASTIKTNTLYSNTNNSSLMSSKNNSNKKTIVSNNLISNPIPNNLINIPNNLISNTNKTINLNEINQENKNEEKKNDNNENNEEQNKKDLYDGHRLLIQISNLIENEPNELEDTIYNSDSFTNLGVNEEEIKEEDKIINTEKNEINKYNLKKSIITDNGRKEINKEKNKLKKEFGKDFDIILNIFIENSNKTYFGYDEIKITEQLKNQGFSQEYIEKIMKNAPGFFSLTVEKKMIEN